MRHDLRSVFWTAIDNHQRYRTVTRLRIDSLPNMQVGPSLLPQFSKSTRYQSESIVYCRWVSSKIITRIISLESAFLRAPNIGNLVQGGHPKFRVDLE